MSSIIFEIKKSVAFLTLNRPEKFNAFNKEMSIQLQKYLDECSLNKQVRAVMITGAGKAFSAGQDISELTGDNAPAIQEILAEHFNPIVQRIRNLQKPVVAAVNGVAAGAGANIALCCDIVIATSSAVFIQAFSKIGLIPDSGGTFMLPRLVGWQKASALMMTGDKVSAAEAERIGMIYKVFSDEIFIEECFRITENLAAMPTIALANTKEALNISFNNTFAEQLKVEDRLQYNSANTYDDKEGIKAFIQKRSPSFKGE